MHYVQLEKKKLLSLVHEIILVFVASEEKKILDQVIRNTLRCVKNI